MQGFESPVRSVRRGRNRASRPIVAGALGWLAAICILFPLLAVPAMATLAFPDRERRAVVDAAAVIPDDAEAALDARIVAWNRATGHQFVVATVPSLQGRPISDYGYQLLRHWGLGRADADDGVILLLAPTEREVRIEVGYGLEAQLTDAASGRIIAETIRPALRRGDIAGALGAGADRIMAVLAAPEAPVPLVSPPPESGFSLTNSIIGVVFLLFLLAVTGLLLWWGGRMLIAIARGLWRGVVAVSRFFARLCDRYWVYLWPLPLLFPEPAARSRARRQAERERRAEEEAGRKQRAAEAAAKAEAERKQWAAREAERKKAERAERAALRERYGKGYDRHPRWCPFEKRILELHETEKLAERDRKIAKIAAANQRAIEEQERLRASRYSNEPSSNWYDRYNQDSGGGGWDSGYDSGFDSGGGSGGGGGADDRY